MECSCNIDVSDDWGGAWKLTEEAIRTARKTHVCVECNRLIMPGEQYEDFRGIDGDDAKWVKYKTCQDCLSLRRAFFSSYFYTFLWENWWEEMNECDWAVPEKCLAQLTPAARARACDSIEHVWEQWGDDL